MRALSVRSASLARLTIDSSSCCCNLKEFTDSRFVKKAMPMPAKASIAAKTASALKPALRNETLRFACSSIRRMASLMRVSVLVWPSSFCSMRSRRCSRFFCAAFEEGSSLSAMYSEVASGCWGRSKSGKRNVFRASWCKFEGFCSCSLLSSDMGRSDDARAKEPLKTTRRKKTARTETIRIYAPTMLWQQTAGYACCRRPLTAAAQSSS